MSAQPITHAASAAPSPGSQSSSNSTNTETMHGVQIYPSEKKNPFYKNVNSSQAINVDRNSAYCKLVTAMTAQGGT